ncbi:hypothetical protein TRIUR3_05565 [Triticum urartu]|uniref:Metallo-beta-lactamase domain-containing protein n=1 Tax=Triticum urartu TaxID=4572 RepID=M8A4D8_TRIUA|nr:hypothetical protein TRIUR3_05565 [Triticum urartu]
MAGVRSTKRLEFILTIIRSMDKIEVIDFHQTLEVNGIRFWCYTTGHVLGAAMFMVDIAGVRILYTGDYSCEEDRHLKAAEIPQFSPDICIIESTYSVQQHQPRHVREKRFTDAIHNTVSQGGRVLIPAYALGAVARPHMEGQGEDTATVVQPVVHIAGKKHHHADKCCGRRQTLDDTHTMVKNGKSPSTEYKDPEIFHIPRGPRLLGAPCLHKVLLGNWCSKYGYYDPLLSVMGEGRVRRGVRDGRGG